MIATDEVAWADAEIPVSRRRKLVGYGLMVLVPLALTAALLVLAAMTANAAATGGCGGG